VPPKPGNKRVSLGGASVVIPRRWLTSGYHGLPSTLAFPIVFYSSARMTTRCSKPTQTLCTSGNWFPRDVVTPTNGVLVSWVDDEDGAPDIQWPRLPGRVTKIHHHIAKVEVGTNDGGCPRGAAREVAAYIRIPTKPIEVGGRSQYTGSRLAMTACFGPHASSTDRFAVSRMLHSLRIHPKHWIR
jgi:hypothetical protein